MGTGVRGWQQDFPTAMPDFLNTVTLAYATGVCGNETWGGVSGQVFAANNIINMQKAGKYYILSTGGARGSFTCGSLVGFAIFLKRYSSPYLVGINFDLKSSPPAAQITDLVTRAKEALTAYPNLRFRCVDVFCQGQLCCKAARCHAVAGPTSGTTDACTWCFRKRVATLHRELSLIVCKQA